MFTNYLKIALRLIRKNKTFSLINIIGLAIGMACCIVILLFVQFELSFDKFHENANQIYRLVLDRKMPTRTSFTTKTGSWIAPQIAQEIPDVLNSTRLFRMGCIIKYKDQKFNEAPLFVDPAFLQIFSFPLIMGNRNSALENPNNILITEDIAEKYFGSEDPIGKILTINNTHDFTVSGILKNVPSNSHFQFDILGSFDVLQSLLGSERKYRRSYTYFLLNKNSDINNLETKIKTFMAQNRGERYAESNIFHLQSLPSIHLNSHRSLELSKNSYLSYSFILALIAFLLLLIACINFINLSTARSTRRSKEVGIRKVIGAKRRQLYRQFLGETLLIALISLIFALVLAELFLPTFNRLMERQLEINLFNNFTLYIGLFILTIFVGIVAGGYPAIFLSSFTPSTILQNKLQFKSIFSIFIRKGLVIFQFTISIIFIVGTIVILRQMKYIQSKDLGFEKGNIISVHGAFVSKMEEKYPQIKNRFLQNPNILDVTASEIATPGYYAGMGVEIQMTSNPEKKITAYVSAVDYNYFDFFGIDLISGRQFDPRRSKDKGNTIIINETAAKLFDMESPIGQQLENERWGIKGVIIGIMKDHHNVSLYETIKPTIYYYRPDLVFSPFVKLKTEAEKTGETIDFVLQTFSEFYPGMPVYYTYLEDIIDRAYQVQYKIFQVVQLSAILSILIACLGMFGLISFSIERRIKEIGIRKILGASTSGIIRLLSTDFIGLILIANFIAWPIAWLTINKWLEYFAYRINMNILFFLLAGFLALLIGLLTIGFQVIKTARVNPVKSLRHELRKNQLWSFAAK